MKSELSGIYGTKDIEILYRILKGEQGTSQEAQSNE